MQKSKMQKSKTYIYLETTGSVQSKQKLFISISLGKLEYLE